ncbi:MotA/TolQ/ExbB proton channel family protein [Candidatus Babeliales bacterium]|nr:MotA/TolQ/ExbB proton channel family protein [Candidatus Babeliales bacterium]
MRFFLGNSLWNLVWQSDAMTKFVLIVLLLASIICWTILFYKCVLLNLKKKQLKEMMLQIQHVSSLDQLVNLARKHDKTYPGHLLIGQLNGAKSIFERAINRIATESELTVLDEQRFSLLEDMVYQEESYMNILSVTSVVSPLLGLFGTVWGLTHSFISISEKQSADIVTIAPGIAEALLTTLAGLIVAIPASMMYHYLKTQTREIEHCLQFLSDTIQTQLRCTLLDEKEDREISLTQKTSPKPGTVTGN